MCPGIDEQAIEIVHNAATALDVRFSMRSLRRLRLPDIWSPATDGAAIFLIDGRRSAEDAVLFLSVPDHPDTAAAAARKAEEARESLPDPIGSAVLTPFHAGRIGAQSFAFYRRLRPLSRSRLRGLQVRQIRRDVHEWLEAVAASSGREVSGQDQVQGSFLAQLEYVEAESCFSTRLRKCAASSHASVRRGDVRPLLVLEHSDFWLGNLLLPRTWPFTDRRRFGFSVIDWLGSTFSGYPYVDLLQFASSAGESRSVLDFHLSRYARRAGVSRADLAVHVCCHIGNIGLNRDQFPLPRFIHSSENLFACAAGAG